MDGLPYFQYHLRRELDRRMANNPRYSLRAFARALSLDPGGLSRMLSGKSVPSLKHARHIVDKLQLSGLERQRFLSSLADRESGPPVLDADEPGGPNVCSTLAVDPSVLPLAKALIHEFCRTLEESLERGEKKRVYQLQVSFFPLDGEE